MKIRLVGAELIYAGRQTDGQTSRCVANAALVVRTVVHYCRMPSDKENGTNNFVVPD